MAVSEYHLDTRIRRRHIPLISQQRRLRHLRSISARNITHDKTLCKELNVAFTLHKKLDSPAFYTSEVILDGFNPSWKDFESSNFPENVDTASSYVIVRIWNMPEEKLLIEWAVFFSGLVYLGEQIPKEGKNFKPNTIIFGMSEGYYGCNDSYQHAPGNANEVAVKDTLDAEVSGLRTSYTLSTLSRIKTIERAIKQTQANVQRRRNSISNKLQSSQDIRNIRAQQELLRIKISVLKKEVQFQQKNLNSLEKEIALYKDDLVKKKSQANGKIIEDKRKLTERCFAFSKAYNEYRERVLKTEAQLNLRRKELITELNCIYPIVEFPDHMGYSILNVHLPNSEALAGHDEKMISVALGYVCHVVLMISQFLNVPLRYNINFFGSQSTIMDHISTYVTDKKEFPLYLKAKDRRTFEYGVFLLNKSIAQLRFLCRLTTHDLSATLANLSSLVELRLSLNSDSHINIPKQSKAPLQSEKPNQNGLTNYPQLDVSQSLIKTNVSEMETLKREMEAMIPNSAQNILHLPIKSKEASTALSSSLDKGLNDIKLLEKSMETMELENKEVPPKSSTQVNLLKQTHHHSSYPNLNSPLRVTGEFDADSIDPSLLSTPKMWTAESSRTNSEEEHIEDDTKSKHSSVVLNDSIFYIPSLEPIESKDVLPEQRQGEIEKVAVSADFSADLSLRTEQLANRKSSFQMQKLRSCSDDEQLPHV